MPFTVDTDRLATTSADITRIAGDIESSVAQMMSRIQSLEGTGWSGGAHAQFQTVVTQWRALQTQVRESLEAVGQLTGKASSSYQSTEDHVRSLFAT